MSADQIAALLQDRSIEQEGAGRFDRASVLQPQLFRTREHS